MKATITHILTALPLVLFLGFWELMSRHVERGAYFYGSPSAVAGHLYRLALAGTLWVDIGVTAGESIAGFLLGTLMGTGLGIALGYWPLAAKILRPYVAALGVIPIFTVAPILVIWFGIGLGAKIALATLSTVFVATFQAFEGVRGVDPDLVFLAQSLRATRWQLFRYVVVPSGVGWVAAGMRLNIGFALLGAFLGEYISSSRGLGHLIVDASGLFNISLALAGVTCICVLALILVLLVSLLERALIPWRFKSLALGV